METKQITGLHHVTAIAGNAKRNFDFYTKVLGMRMVKKTVNFDDPETYHFYYGDETGTPGTILTFFPWGDAVPAGRRGARQATETGFSVPAGSLEYWKDRLDAHNVLYNNVAQKFGEQYLTLLDPDGLKLELTVATGGDKREPWLGGGISTKNAIRGFHHITITAEHIDATARVLKDILGYEFQQQEVNRYRFGTDAVQSASIVDLVQVQGEDAGIVGRGSVHHVAFRVPDVDTLMYFREKVLAHGLHITPKIDRNYFFSLYFREPGGVLFEIATDVPGFLTDETIQELGTGLMLPAQYEARRNEIELILPKLG